MGKKILVTYFSCSGVTARVAENLADVVKGDLFEIKPLEPYTSADLNWRNNNSRSSIEMNDESSRPAIANKIENFDSYDVIFVGFPIWWGIAPRIIETFLESYDLSGKTVIPFCTSGGSGVGRTDEVLHSLCPSTVAWKPCKRISAVASKSELDKYVKSLNL